MRNFSDTLGQVFRAIAANKLRTFLTMFGIAWGVGSLLVLVGLGEGFRSGQRKQLATLGNDVIFMSGRHHSGAGQPAHRDAPLQADAEGRRAALSHLTELRNVTVELAPLRPVRGEPVGQHFRQCDGH